MESYSERTGLSKDSLERILNLERGDKIITRKYLEPELGMHDSDGNSIGLFSNELYTVNAVFLKIPEQTINLRSIEVPVGSKEGCTILKFKERQSIEVEDLLGIYVSVTGRGAVPGLMYSILYFQI